MEKADPIGRAIALRSARALAQAIDGAPDGWQERVHRGFTCWTRVLVDHRRTFLMDVLIEKGWRPPAMVVHRGQVIEPLRLAIKYGNLEALKVLLAQGADPNALTSRESLPAYATERFSRQLDGTPFNSAANPACWPQYVVDPLEKATALLLSYGARPCPRALGVWLALAPNRSGMKWLDYAEQAWASGVRPPNRLLGINTPPEKIALDAYQSDSRLFLQEVLQWYMERQSPSPSWIQYLGREFLRHAQVEALLEIMDRVHPSPLGAEDWDRKTLVKLQRLWRVFKGFSPHNPRLPEVLTLVKWALRNQMPYPALFWPLSTQSLSLVESLNPETFEASSTGKEYPEDFDDYLRMLLSALPEGLGSPDSPMVQEHRTSLTRPIPHQGALDKTTVEGAWFATPGWAPHRRRVKALLSELVETQMHQAISPATEGACHHLPRTRI